MTTDLDTVQAALFAGLQAAFAELDDPPEFRLDDPRRIEVDADDEADGQTGEIRSLVSLQPGRSDDDGQPAIGPTIIYNVTARFALFVDVVGPDDAVRKARAKLIRNTASAWIAANFTLSGAASFVRCSDLDRETLIGEGMPTEHLENLGISVEFPSLSPVG